MAIDQLDVTAPTAQRQALLQRVLGQTAQNLQGTRSFDQLNSRSAHTVGLSVAPGLSNSLSSAPTPSAGPGRFQTYPGTPVTGTASFLSLPPALQQIFLRPSQGPSAPGAMDDITRAVLAARSNQNG